jgi:predicted permease
MDITTRFILFQVLIIAPFAAGMAAKRRWRFRNLPAFTKRLIRVNLVLIEPVIVLWSTWGLVLTKDLVMLPLAGLFLVAAGMAFGGVIRGRLGMSGKKGATFLISSSLANHGFTMGAFLCYLFLGERGLGLAFLFLAYFMPYIFLVIFPYARRVSTGEPFSLATVRDFFLNLQNMPFYAVVGSVILLSLGIQRPGLAFPVDLFIIVSMALYYFTLGLNFEMPSFFTSGRENAALAGIKFILVPAVTLLILAAVHLDPALEAVILLQAFMPAAIYSVVASVLYELDAALASNMFVWNTLIFLAGVLPAIFVCRDTITALIR